jgi:hypothetical protein
MTGCDCPLSGYCERHKVDKTPHLFHLCKTNRKYYNAWEEGRGIGQRMPKAEQEFRAKRRALPVVCAHRGEVLGKSGCGCEGSPEVYQCKLHEYAMEHKVKPGKMSFKTEDGTKHRVEMAYCSGCEDFERAEPPAIYPAIKTRNLIYHVYPAPGWLDAIQEIATHRDLFNGNVHVAIAFNPDTDIETVSRQVERILEPDRIFLIENDPVIRETATFPTLLESILNASRTEATFYAHTKANTTADGVCGATKWRQVMVKSLLGRSEDAMQHLRRHPFVGTHKMIWPAGQAAPFPTRLAPTYPWMHAGTFWWFRHDMVSSRHRPELIARDRYGVEGFPAQLFPHEMAYSMWQPWDEDESAWPQRNPYDPQLYETDYSK